MYLYGASGHAKVIIEILELKGIEIKGLFDDNPAINKLLDYPCYGPLTNDYVIDELIVSIGDNLMRKNISNRLNCQFGKAIHPSAKISSRSTIRTGTVVMANAVINSGTIVGKHVIINTTASVDHDCIIGDYVHISPNATLCGGVSVGEGTHIGAAAVIIPNITIGKWSVIGAGSVVIRDIPDYAVVVGNPGRIIKLQTKIDQLF